MEAPKPKAKPKTPPTKRKSRAAKLRFMQLNTDLLQICLNFSLFFVITAKNNFYWRLKRKKNVMHVHRK